LKAAIKPDHVVVIAAVDGVVAKRSAQIKRVIADAAADLDGQIAVIHDDRVGASTEEHLVHAACCPERNRVALNPNEVVAEAAEHDVRDTVTAELDRIVTLAPETRSDPP
jgi:hypothetical protein